MKKNILVVLILSLLIITHYNVDAQRITITLAGGGGYNGDGKAGYLTSIGAPNDVCMDAAHNLYFVSNYDHRIRRVSADKGIVTTVATATSPQYMCIDPTGELYFSDGNSIGKVNPSTGAVSVIAGLFSAGYAGDNGLATLAKLNQPQGICIDAAGNIYIADQGNNCIRKVTAATGVITTIAGTGVAGYTGDGGPATSATLQSPLAICVNSAGDIFFSDQGSGTFSGEYIRKINATTGVISTIAGNGGGASGDGGPAISAGIGNVNGICVDGSADIYINDISCSCRKITMSTGIITTVAGSDATDGYNGDGINSILSLLNYPHGLCVDATGNIYIADNHNDRVRKAIQLTHTPSFAYGKGQYITPCSGYEFSINSLMAITDIDAGQAETWAVINAPINGSLSGFPCTTTSGGSGNLVSPTGLSYTGNIGSTVPDSFRVRVTDGTFSDTITIYVSAVTLTHAPWPISGPDSVCAESVIQLTDSVSSGTWSMSGNNATINAEGYVTGVSFGIDTVIYSINTTCTTRITTTIFVKQLPNAGVISGIDSIYVGSTTNLSNTISGGVWSSNDNFIDTISSIGQVYGVSYGANTIVYTVTNGGCDGYAYFVLFVLNNPTSIDNITPLGINALSVNPNPTASRFIINVCSSFDEHATITITNIVGEKMKEITGNTNKPIDASLDVPAGVYLLNATTAHGNVGGKIVIE